MTAEVAVINSIGVALAADSAVTIGSEKIYNSALKLFSLSKTEPVGIMIYGNAEIMGVPWETIIKMFRSDLDTTPCNNLHQYSDKFFKFLTSNNNFFPRDIQKEWLKSNTGGYYKIIFDELISEVENLIKESGKITGESTDEIFNSTIDKHFKEVRSRPLLRDMNEEFEKEIKTKFRKQIKSVRDEIFKKLTISRSSAAKLNSIAAMVHTRDIFSQSKSGIVVAGFGANDLYPALETHEVDGVINGKVKYKRLENKCVKSSKGVECTTVVPFAQEDMVASFMNGLNPSVHAFIASYLAQVFERLPEIIDRDKLTGSEDKKNQALKQYGKDIESLLEDFFVQLNLHTQKEHVQPIMQMVNALPKDELAAMAESLVNLTAFKRKMSRTVSGGL